MSDVYTPANHESSKAPFVAALKSLGIKTVGLPTEGITQQINMSRLDHQEYDYLIIGAGIIGLSVARELHVRKPHARVCIIEKEKQIAEHASGRNSGVLHAGFYYTANTLKARFTRDGNRRLRNYCYEHGLRINPCGKLVVASSAKDLEVLEELKQRGDRNQVPLEWVEESDLHKIEPRAKTYERALFSPSTATVDPREVCCNLYDELRQAGVAVHTGVQYLGQEKHHLRTSAGIIRANSLINCAGLYADRIAKEYGFCKDFIMLPFKGQYLQHRGSQPPVRTNIYPVPNLANPFLGVHFTVAVDGSVKIGPSAVPALWREHYSGWNAFSLRDLCEVGFHEAKLFARNSSGFRTMAWSEVKKLRRKSFTQQAAKLVKTLADDDFDTWGRPGIRAQLLQRQTGQLIEDFILEGDSRSLHVLNVVSPAFTCAFPIAEYLVDRLEENGQSKASR